MKIEIVTHGETTVVEVDPGLLTLGGSGDDGIQIPGMEPAQVELRVEATHLVLVNQRTFSVDGVLSPAGVARMVVPDEQVALTDWLTLRQVPERDAAESIRTAAVLKDLLLGAGDPEVTTCATLTCLTGLDVGRRFPVAGEVLEVGRGDDVGLRIRDRAVSRRHARLRRVPDGYTLEDLGTANGVFVNGKTAEGPTLLPDGAIVEIGQSLLRYAAAAREPEPEEVEVEVEDLDEAPPPLPAEAAAELRDAEPPAAPPSRGHRLELMLVGLGMTLALAGVVVAFGFV